MGKQLNTRRDLSGALPAPQVAFGACIGAQSAAATHPRRSQDRPKRLGRAIAVYARISEQCSAFMFIA